MDTTSFEESENGRIVGTIIREFAKQTTFENAQRFSPHDWMRLLTRFYDLSSYLVTPINPSFTKDICTKLPTDSVTAIRLANLVANFEPMVVRQRIALTKIQTWMSFLEDKATTLIDVGNRISSDDDPQDYDDWQEELREYLEAVRDLANWTSLTEIAGASELSELRSTVERPKEDGYEEEDDSYRGESGPYLTIERIFEDL
jgi:hypothetical protein